MFKHPPEGALRLWCTAASLVLLLVGCGGGSPPLLTLTPSVLSVEYTLGGQAETAGSFSVSNTGGGTLNWRITQQPNFAVSVSPRQGSLTANQSTRVTGRFTCTEPGEQRGTVVITSENNEPQRISVVLSCVAPPIDIATSDITASVTTPLEPATNTLSWSFSSSWEGQGAVDYSITSDDERLLMNPVSGRDEKETDTEVELTFNCNSVEDLTPTIVVTANGVTAEVIWPVSCIHPPIAMVVDSIPTGQGTPITLANSSLIWHFESDWSDHPAESYTIQSNPEGVAISNAEGTIEPDQNLTVELAYACTSIEELDIEITLNIRDNALTTNWEVSCVPPPVDITVAAVELTNVGTLPGGATGALSWSFSSAWADHGAESFEIISMNPLVSSTPSQGTTTPGETVGHVLTFACIEPISTIVDLTIVVGEEQVPATWEVVCVAPPIELRITNQLQSTALVGDQATDTLMWSFTSPWSGESPRDYQLSAIDTNIVVSKPMGGVALNESSNHTLSFSCETPGRQEFGLRLSIGDTINETVTWSVFCVELTIDIDRPAAATAFIGEEASGTLNWSVIATPDPNIEWSYELTSPHTSVTLDPSTSTVRTGQSQTNQLMFACESVATNTVNLSLRIGSHSEEITWEVSCKAPPIRIDLPKLGVNIAVLDERVTADVKWSIRSLDGKTGSVPYTFTSNDDRVSISPTQGNTRLDSLIHTRLTYNCETVGEFTPIFNIRASGVTSTLAWSIKCLESHAISLHLVSIPPSTGVVSQTATSSLSWRFSSTDPRQPALAYTITNDLANASSSPQSGTASVETNQTADLSFRCETTGDYQATYTVTIEGEQASATWNVECVVRPSVSIDIQPIVSTQADVGKVASGALRWSYSTTSGNPTLNYTISNDGSASASPKQGSARNGVAYVSSLTFSCQAAGNYSLQWTITLDGTSKSAVWNVTCSEPSDRNDYRVKVTQGDDVTSRANTSGTTTNYMTWRLNAAPDTNRDYLYTIEFNTDRASASPDTGIIRFKQRVSSTLTFSCGAQAQNHSIKVFFKINGVLVETANWTVKCRTDVYRIRSVQFYQGPMVARLERHESEGVVTYQPEVFMDFVRHREAHVGVDVEFSNSKKLTHFVGNNGILATTTEGSTTRSLSTVHTINLQPETSDSGYFETTWVYPIPAQSINEQLVVNVDLNFEPSSDGVKVPPIALSDFTVAEVPEITLKFFRIKDGADVAPVFTQSRVNSYTRRARELLPLASVVTEFSNTPLTPRERADGEDKHPCDYLYPLYEEWAANGSDRMEFYYGEFDWYCCTFGCSILPGNVATGWDNGYDTFAHELGHNLFLGHSPCGTTGGLERDYPYPGGRLGPVRGWSTSQKKFITEDGPHRDFMSYCDPAFTSDFHYKKAKRRLAYLLRTSNQSSLIENNIQVESDNNRAKRSKVQMEYRTLAITGSIDATGHWTLNKASLSTQRPLERLAMDHHRVVVWDDRGNRLGSGFVSVSELIHSSEPGSLWVTRFSLKEGTPDNFLLYDGDNNVVLQGEIDLHVEGQ